MIPQTVKKITLAQAQVLAQNSQPAFKLSAAYLTYPDTATANGITNGEDFTINDSNNDNTGLMEYVVADGTYPIRKDRKMFPR